MLPLELLSELVLQPLKGLLAHELAARGYSQGRIGHILGVSQPAVSAYLKVDRESYMARLAGAGIMRDEVERVLKVVATAVEQGNYSDAVEYINNFALSLLSSLRLCEAHRSVAPYLKGCDVCKNISIFNEVKNRINIAFNIIKNNSNTIYLVPEVFMNIVELSDEGPIGYPGRIIVAGGALVKVAEPQLWGSRFLGKLIIEVNKIHKNIKSVINIKNNDKILNCINKNFKYTIVGPSNSEEETIANIVSAMRESYYDVVVDKGGVSIESNAYVFGYDAPDVASKIVKIAQCITYN